MKERPSPNHDERKLPVSMLVLHYTGMPDAASAIVQRLTGLTPDGNAVTSAVDASLKG